MPEERMLAEPEADAPPGRSDGKARVQLDMFLSLCLSLLSLFIAAILAGVWTLRNPGEESDESLGRVLLACELVKVDPDAPQDVAAKCSAILREHELAEQRKEEARFREELDRIRRYPASAE